MLLWFRIRNLSYNLRKWKYIFHKILWPGMAPMHSLRSIVRSKSACMGLFDLFDQSQLDQCGPKTSKISNDHNILYVFQIIFLIDK